MLKVPSRRALAVATALAATTACACSSRSDSGAGSTSREQPAKVVGPGIEISADDRVVSKIPYAALSEHRTRLTEHLPDGLRDSATWTRLAVRGGDRLLAVDGFVDRYPNHDVMLWLDERARPTVGLLRRAPAGAPAHVTRQLATPKLFLVDVESIALRTEPLPELEPARMPPLEVAVVGGETRTLSSEDLHSLAATMPFDSEVSPRDNGNRRRRRGWHLRDIIQPLVDTSGVASVTLRASDGATAILSGEQLRDPDSRPLLRENRRRRLRLQLWRRGERAPVWDLRDVRHITVEPVPPPQ